MESAAIPYAEWFYWVIICVWFGLLNMHKAHKSGRAYQNYCTGTVATSLSIYLSCLATIIMFCPVDDGCNWQCILS